MKNARLSELQLTHAKAERDLIEKLDRAVVALKFKPKKELKDYQTQEKLVSIDERYVTSLKSRLNEFINND